MQLIEVTQRRDLSEKKFVYSQSVFQTYFLYITNYSDPDTKPLTLPEWMKQFLGDDEIPIDPNQLEKERKRLIQLGKIGEESVARAFSGLPPL